MKHCTRCSKYLSYTQFWPNRGAHSPKDGYMSWCKNCALEYKRIYTKRRYNALRQEVLSILSSECIRCGFDDPRALQIDHINGGGNAERKRLGSGTTYHKHMLKDISKYQLLCANCNQIKKHDRSEVAFRETAPIP